MAIPGCKQRSKRSVVAIEPLEGWRGFVLTSSRTVTFHGGDEEKAPYLQGVFAVRFIPRRDDLKENMREGWRLIKQTFFYGMVGSADTLVALILVPVYTRSLTPDMFGALQLVNMYISLAFMFCSLGMRNAYIRVYHFTDSEKREGILGLTVILQLMAVGTLLISMACIYLLNLKLPAAFSNTWTPSLFLLWLFSLVSCIFSSIGFSHLRAEEKASDFAVAGCSGAVMGVVFNLTFIFVLDLGIEGILLSNVLTNSAVAFWILGKMRHSCLPSPFPATGKIARELLSFGLPLVPAAMALWGIDLADRYILDLYHGGSVVGVYSLGYKYASVLPIGITMLHTAWVPALLRIYREKDDEAYQRFFVSTASGGMAIVAAGALVLYLMRR